MERSLSSTRKESNRCIRRQPVTVSKQSPGHPVRPSNKIKLDFQSRLRQCLDGKGSVKTRSHPDYQSCLEECVRYYCHGKHFEKCYKGYPIPSPQVWRKCLEEALLLLGRDATALTCMRRYEIILAKRGRTTVAACMAVLTLMDMVLEEEIPEAIVVAEVMRQFNHDDLLENPFYLLRKAEKIEVMGYLSRL